MYTKLLTSAHTSENFMKNQCASLSVLAGYVEQFDTLIGTLTVKEMVIGARYLFGMDGY